MRKFVAATITAIVVALSVVHVSPAMAVAGCINHQEFVSIQKGWTRSQVENFISATGARLSIHDNVETWEYVDCGRDPNITVLITFTNGLVSNKQWINQG